MKKKILGVVIFLLVCIAIVIIYFTYDKNGYIDINVSELEKIVSSKDNVYVYFYSENFLMPFSQNLSPR